MAVLCILSHACRDLCRLDHCTGFRFQVLILLLFFDYLHVIQYQGDQRKNVSTFLVRIFLELPSMENSTTQRDVNQSVGDAETPVENTAEDEQTAENSFEKKKRERTSMVLDEFKKIVLLDGSKKAK